MNNDLTHHQSDMRAGYCSGGAGVLASALAWLVAACITWRMSPQQGVWALFVGGMLIHPVGVALCKVFGGSGVHAKGNPLGSLAIASTLWLIFSLPLAYAVSVLKVEWFFPAMLLVIGGRYLVFGTLFGMRAYWLLGLALAGAGFLLGRAVAPAWISAFIGVAIEAGFAVALLVAHRRWASVAGAPTAPAPANP